MESMLWTGLSLLLVDEGVEEEDEVDDDTKTVKDVVPVWLRGEMGELGAGGEPGEFILRLGCSESTHQSLFGGWRTAPVATAAAGATGRRSRLVDDR